MSNQDERPKEERAALDEFVRIQQRMVRRWSKYTVESLDRFQSGDLDPKTWLDAYGRLASETAEDFVSSVDALSKLRSPW
jgi:hypothetical protein